jgi:hypothetical protein
MKTINAANYKTDSNYERLTSAVDTLLKHDNVVRPVDVFVTLGLLTPQRLSDWRAGRIPYLERVIICNLSKAGRILRILRLHAHDLKLRESHTVYQHRGHPLRFSKTGEPKVEEAYSRHFVRPKGTVGPSRSAVPVIDPTAKTGCPTPDAPSL